MAQLQRIFALFDPSEVPPLELSHRANQKEGNGVDEFIGLRKTLFEQFVSTIITSAMEDEELYKKLTNSVPSERMEMYNTYKTVLWSLSRHSEQEVELMAGDTSAGEQLRREIKGSLAAVDSITNDNVTDRKSTELAAAIYFIIINGVLDIESQRTQALTVYQEILSMVVTALTSVPEDVVRDSLEQTKHVLSRMQAGQAEEESARASLVRELEKKVQFASRRKRRDTGPPVDSERVKRAHR